MSCLSGQAPTTGPNRRSFITLAATTMGVVGAGSALWVLGDSLNPAADTRRYNWYDISAVKVGERHRFAWRGKPIVVHHRTSEQTRLAAHWRSASRYPEAEERRTQDPAWFVAIEACTNRGCLLLDRIDDNGGPQGEAWSVPVPVHPTTFPAGSCVGRPPKTSFCHPTSSMAVLDCGSAKAAH